MMIFIIQSIAKTIYRLENIFLGMRFFFVYGKKISKKQDQVSLNNLSSLFSHINENLHSKNKIMIDLK